MLAITVAVLVLFCLCSTAAFGQCTLSGPVSSWNDGTGNWSNGSDWTGGVPNSPTQSVCITNGTMGAPSVVNLNIDASINNLQLGTFDTLNFEAGTQLEVFGTQIINAGQININSGGGANALLELANNVTLSGAGTLTLANTGGGGTAIIYQASAGLTLTNQSTIAGAGTIGFNGLSLINQGTVDANASGQTLEFSSMTNGINNAGGLLQASNGGLLLLDGITVAGGGTITVNAGSTVQLVGNTDIVGGTLNNIGGTLGTPNGNAAFLDGSTAAGPITINGNYTNGVGSTTYILGTINNKNNFQLNAGGGANSVLIIDSANVTLQGGGTVTMANSGGGGSAIIYQETSGSTLTNVNNTIQGAGTIGFNGLSVVNEATINANLSGQTLTLDSMSNGLNNTGGLLEASNGGALYFDGVTVNNTGANITANAGSMVQLVGNTTIQGGTLTNNGSFFGTPNGNSATLDGSTGAGAITINGTYTNGVGSTTYILGTINNNNLIQLNAGGGANSALEIDSANLILQGGGTVTMSNSGGGGDALIYQAAGGLTLTNVNNTIQGSGIIGFNGLTVVNEAIINANGSGQTLTLESMSGGLTNTGMLEASNGGTLYFDAVTVNNAGGGTITANAGSTVQFVGNPTIQGGTLTNNGTFFGTPDGNSAILDGSTAAGAITINGTYTNGNASTTYILGTINNNNNFLVTTTGIGDNSELEIDSKNVTLQGGGTVTLSTASGSGAAILLQAAGGLTLTNVNNTIQGEGIIGFNGLTLVNEAGGTINANSMGGSQITTLTIESASITNQGLIEATNSGTLLIDAVTINNQGGTIAAIGAGATVQLVGNADIQGGTLTNNGGAFFGTPNGNEATLDGSTVAGAVTINGTYTNGNNSTILLLGTINNQGNILLNGGNGNNSDLEIDSATVTLTGGGTVTLSTAGGGGNATILQAAGGLTLENFNNTIQGAGIIGDNGLSLLNDAGGTILANASGQTLTINGGGTVTNNGTFQANSGSALVVGNVTFTNFAGNTLTGGTYNVYGTLANPGTLQINPLGNTGGEIVNNAATILLDGPNSNFVDEAGKDALSNFSNNTAAGSFTIQDGRDFTGPNNVNFANAGIVDIGAGSTFATGGTGQYNQSGGSTQVDGALVAGGGQANFNGGTLFGNGTITGNVMMAGTIYPGDAPNSAGKLSITGNYTQTGTGAFNLSLGGLGQGTQFSWLNVSGNASLAGTLNVGLINSFVPTVGETFTFLTAGGSRSGIFSTVNGLDIGGNEALTVIYDPSDVKIQAIMCANGSDCWVGGTDIWSKGSKWTLGEPVAASAVYINSGATNDVVTLNVGSTTVSSVQLGEASGGGFTSELTDGGTKQTLNITNELAIGQTGTLSFTGGSTVNAGSASNQGTIQLSNASTLATTGGLNNSGTLDLENASVLKVTGDVTNSGSLGASLNGGGTGGNTITIDGMLTNGGTFQLNGSKDMATLGSLTNNAGAFVDVEGGSTLTITGNVTNSGAGANGIYTSFNGTGHNTLNINGNLTNSGMVGIESTGDTATIGGNVSNSGSFQVTGGSMATIKGNLTTNTGTVDLENASTLQINGNADNSGTLSTSANGGTGSNTVTVDGSLTNEAGGQITLKGSGDLLQVNGVGGLTNLNLGTVNVTNGGAIDSMVVTNGGTINIDGMSKVVVGTGAAPGLGYIQLANGTLGEIINMSGYGVINVTGAANLELGSTLNILLQAGYNPTNGTLIQFLNFTPGELTGTFGTILNDTFNGGTQYWLLVAGSGFLELEAEPVMSGGTDFWNGGTGNWSNNPQWSLGNYPTPTEDAVIYSDIENDLVTLDLGSTTVKSLTLGGSDLTYSSTLTDGGTTQTLTITNGLTIGASGILSLTGGSTITAGADSSNAGSVDLENGSKLGITGNFTNSGNFQTGGTGGNKVNISGMLTNTGTFLLNGPGDLASIGNGVTNSGIVDVEDGSTLVINGDVTNSGQMGTMFYGRGGGNTLTITGNLTTSNDFELDGPGDVGNVGTLTLGGGFVGVAFGTTLNLTNQPGGITDIPAGTVFELGGTFNAGANNGFYQLTSVEGSLNLFNGQTTVVTPIGGTFTVSSTGFVVTDTPFAGHTVLQINGALANSGLVDAEEAGAIQISGDVANNGTLATNYNGFGGGSTITIGGTLTNSGTFQLNGPMDMATIGNGMGTALTNSGFVDVEGGSTLQINGDVLNSSAGIVVTGISTNGNNLIIFGSVDNSGEFGLGGTGDMLNVTGTFTNELTGEAGPLGINSKATMAALVNLGDFDVEYGSTLQVNGNVSNSGILATNYFGGGGGNTVNITGMLTNEAGGTFQLGGPGDMATIGTPAMPTSMSNAGTVDLENGSSLTVNGTADNSGTLGASLNGGGTGGNTITITGMLTNTAAGTITLNGPGDVLSALAGLSNSGVINVNNGSSIVPPTFNNLGTLNIDGTSRFVVGTPIPMGGQGYIQTANGVLGEMIASMNSFGVINVNGSALLNGTLDVLLQGGYNPGVGSMYKFLNFTSGELSGMFANIPANGMFTSDGEQWMITYDNADGYVELTAEGRQVVSEPGTLLVLIPGLLGMGYGLRRRLLK
jgi:hypothetical protein